MELKNIHTFQPIKLLLLLFQLSKLSCVCSHTLNFSVTTETFLPLWKQTAFDPGWRDATALWLVIINLSLFLTISLKFLIYYQWSSTLFFYYRLNPIKHSFRKSKFNQTIWLPTLAFSYTHLILKDKNYYLIFL